MSQGSDRTAWTSPHAVVTMLVVALGAAGFTASPALAAGPDLQTEVLLSADGTAPFDAGAGPGLDSGDANQVVRTLDTTAFQVNWSANDPQNTTPILTLQLPAGGYAFTNEPAGPQCPGGLTVSLARDRITCNMGPFNTGADSVTQSVTLNVSVPASVPNGSQFSVRADFGDGTVAVNGESPLVSVSAAPNVDLFKAGCFTVCVGSRPEVTEVDSDGDGTPDTRGFIYDYAVGLRTDSTRGKGIAQLAEPLSITDDVRIPDGAGTNDSSFYPVGAGQPGLRLVGCDSTSGNNAYWPRSAAGNDRGLSVDPISVTCDQPGGKGTAVDITLSNFDWDRTAPPPTAQGQGNSSFISGLLGYAHVKYFLSYEDWERIGTDRGNLTSVPLPGGGTRLTGTVRLGDRLSGTTALGDPYLSTHTGICPTVGASIGQGWRASPADLDLTDPSTFDPLDLGGGSNLGARVESALNNGACMGWTILAPVPSRAGLAFTKFGITSGTTTGRAVAPDATVQSGLAMQNNVTLNSEAGIDDPAMQGAVGTTMCDKWDNRRFGPDPVLGEDWMAPQATADAADGGRQDYNAEYGDAGSTIEYGIGEWGTHGGADEGTSYYWQARSRCEDTPTPFVSASNTGSRLLPLPAMPGDSGDVYWVSADEVDFTNSDLERVNVEDLNAVRVRLNQPLGGMFPSEVAARNGDADPTNDTSTITDVDPVVRTTQARFQLNWRNRPGVPLPTQMRNYAALDYRLGNGSTWISSAPLANSSNDTTRRAPVYIGCGSPCGVGFNVGGTNYSLWWQVLGSDVALEKTRVDGGGAPVANNGTANPGDEVRWRVRARGVPPLGTPAATPGSTPTVTLMDVLPPGLDYVAGSTLSSGEVTLGEPTILPNNSLGRTDPAYAGYTTLQWTVPSLAWAANFTGAKPVELTFGTTMSPDVAPNRAFVQSFYATAPSITLPGESGSVFDPAVSNRVITAQVRSPAGGATAVLNKTVTPSSLMKSTPFNYSLKYANYSATPIVDFDAIDILPWAGDTAHARRSQFGSEDPIQLLGVRASTKGEVAWVSTVDPVTLDAADTASGHTADPAHDGYLDPDYAEAVGGAQWPCTVSQVGQGGAPAGCPSDLTEVTALRFVGDGSGGSPFLAANSGPFTITLDYTTTADAEPGDLYDNSWMARFDNLLPVYRPILVPPAYAAPGVSVEKQSGPTATGPWSESTLVHAGDPVHFQVTVTNTGTNPLQDVTFEDAQLAACESPSPAPPANLAPGASFTFVCEDPGPDAAYTNAITVHATDSDGNPSSDTDTAGVRLPARVGDFVWQDTDRDGVQDPGEPGIENVQLTLTGPGGAAVDDIDGNPVGAATTAADGSYAFGNLPLLPAGQHYTVQLDDTQPALDGYEPTLAGEGGDPAADSSAASAESGDLTGADAADFTLDFGFVAPAASVGDRVWRDTDGDGIQDPGEPGIEHVVVTLTGPGGGAVTDVAGNPVGPVQTDASGGYAFVLLPLLPVGEHYTVHVDPDQPALAGADLVPTLAGEGGDSASDSSTATAESGDLDQPGAADVTLDFGFQPLVGLCGNVYADVDLDTLLGAADAPVGATTVTLSGTDDLGDPVTATVATQPDGTYCFPVRPGTYTLTLTPPDGWEPDTPTELGPITVPPSGDSPGHDFGLVQADLAITKTVTPASPAPGELATYTLEVVNHGPTGANDVTVTDALPQGLAFVGASVAGCSESGGTVSCAIDSLPADGSVSIVLQTRVTQTTAGEIVNTASVEGSPPDPVASNDESSATITVVPPAPPEPPESPEPPAPPVKTDPPPSDLGAPRPVEETPPVVAPVPAPSRAAETPKPGKPRARQREAALKARVTASRTRLEPGETTTLSITVQNPHDVAVRNVQVCDILPASLAYVSATPKPTTVGERVCFTIRVLKPGAKAVVRVKAKALYTPRGSRLDNRVTVGATAVKNARLRGKLQVLPARVSDRVTG